MNDPEVERLLEKKLRSYAAPKEGAGVGSITLTAENFDRQVNGPLPVIVDFWAAWCGPCRVMEPVFEKLARKYVEKIVFGRLNVDENNSVAGRYGVFSIPTFIIFKGGKPVESIIGAVGEGALDRFIASNLSS